MDGEIKMQLDESMKMEIAAHGDRGQQSMSYKYHLGKLEKCNNIELAQEYIPDYVHNAYVHVLKYEGKPNRYHDAIFTFYPIFYKENLLDVHCNQICSAHKKSILNPNFIVILTVDILSIGYTKTKNGIIQSVLIAFNSNQNY